MAIPEGPGGGLQSPRVPGGGKRATLVSPAALGILRRGNDGVIQLDVDLPDRPGEFAKVLGILAAENINIDAMSANSGAGRSYVSVITDAPIKARQSLAKAGYECAQRTVLVVQLPDTPGAFAGLAHRLGAAGVDILSVVQLENVGDHVQLAISVDNMDAARGLV